MFPGRSLGAGLHRDMLSFSRESQHIQLPTKEEEELGQRTTGSESVQGQREPVKVRGKCARSGRRDQGKCRSRSNVGDPRQGHQEIESRGGDVERC